LFEPISAGYRFAVNTLAQIEAAVESLLPEKKRSYSALSPHVCEMSQPRHLNRTILNH